MQALLPIAQQRSTAQEAAHVQDHCSNSSNGGDGSNGSGSDSITKVVLGGIIACAWSACMWFRVFWQFAFKFVQLLVRPLRFLTD